jgi:hypothetical protein
MAPSVIDFISMRPPRGCHVHHSCHVPASLEARLGNPSLTRCQARQPKACPVSSSSSHQFWRCNQHIISHLVLRPKPRNYRGDFVGQITKPHLLVLRPIREKPSTLVLRLNKETHATHLLTHDVDHTHRHPTSRSFSQRVPNMCTKFPTPSSTLVVVRHAAPVTYTS